VVQQNFTNNHNLAKKMRRCEKPNVVVFLIWKNSTLSHFKESNTKESKAENAIHRSFICLSEMIIVYEGKLGQPTMAVKIKLRAQRIMRKLKLKG
jgi:hypothetical protein